MAVYVDDMRANFGNMIMCHMIADTLDELNEMADRIGVNRKWLQKTSHIHYDIALSKKKLAISYGAQEITWRQMAMMSKTRDCIGFLPKPYASKITSMLCRSIGFESSQNHEIREALKEIVHKIEQSFHDIMDEKKSMVKENEWAKTKLIHLINDDKKADIESILNSIFKT